MELLPQTLEEFSVSSSGLGLIQGTLTTVYNESERLRRRKLQAARREREKIIAEECSGERKSRDNKVVCDHDVRLRENGKTETTKRRSTTHMVHPTAALTNKVCVFTVIV